MHPGMLRKAIDVGRRADLRRARGARQAGRRLRLQLPLGDAGRLLGDADRRRPGRALGDGDELVPPRRAALHRVRLLVRGDPHLRAVPVDVRPRLQHEPRPPELGGGDGVRAARRRRGPHGQHALPHLPGPAPARARAGGAGAPRAGGGQLPPRRLRPGRVLLRRPLRQPPDRLHLQHGPARHPRRVLGLRRRGAGPGGRPTTSCSSPCPTTTSTPTATGPRRRPSRSPRPTSTSPAWSRPAGGWTPSCATMP